MSTMTDYQKAITAARAAGISIPGPLSQADEKSRRTVTTTLSTAEAEKAVAEADTEEAFAAAVLELQRAMSTVQAGDKAVRSRVTGIHSAMLRDAFVPVAGDLLEEACHSYNEHAPAFVDALMSVPDLTGLKPAEITPAISQALADARATVVPLAKAWHAYRAVRNAQGDKIGQGESAASASRVVGVLGTVMDPEQHHRAVSLVHAYARNDKSLSLVHLGPHAAIARAGGVLSMAMPSVAQARTVIVPEQKHATIITV